MNFVNDVRWIQSLSLVIIWLKNELKKLRKKHTQKGGFRRALTICGKEVNLNVDTDGQGQ